MMNYGEVRVRNNKEIEDCFLVGFTTVSVPVIDRISKQTNYKSIVYGVVENKETGNFYAKQLSEIKRKK